MGDRGAYVRGCCLVVGVGGLRRAVGAGWAGGESGFRREVRGQGLQRVGGDNCAETVRSCGGRCGAVGEPPSEEGFAERVDAERLDATEFVEMSEGVGYFAQGVKEGGFDGGEVESKSALIVGSAHGREVVEVASGIDGFAKQPVAGKASPKAPHLCAEEFHLDGAKGEQDPSRGGFAQAVEGATEKGPSSADIPRRIEDDCIKLAEH